MDKKVGTTLSKIVTKMVVIIAALLLLTISSVQAAGPSWAFGFNRDEYFRLVAPGDRGNGSGLDLDFGLPEPEFIPGNNWSRPAPAPAPAPAPVRVQQEEEEEEEPAPPAPAPAPAAAPPPAPACTPTYAQPTLTLTSVDPPYPIPIGQDPVDEGFDVTITAQGGAKTNSCSSGPARASLTSLSVVSVNLSTASISWIEDELSQSYPGASVLDSYPLVPADTDGSIETLSFHVDSLDPGNYVITAEARQDRGSDRVNTGTYNVNVSLMEGTIWGGGGN